MTATRTTSTSEPTTTTTTTRAPLSGPDLDVGALVRRLRRVEGQVGGLVRMLESGRDCTDVVTQLAAASRALDRVGFLLVASELRRCVTSRAGEDPDPAAAQQAAAVEKLFLTLA